ncbi:sugar ABC transporter permease, partial [Halobacteriales archaeon SW_12_67_38]
MSVLRSLVRWVRRGENREVATDGGTTIEGEARSGRTRSTLQQYWLIPFAVIGLFVYGAIGWNFVISLTDYTGFGAAEYTDLDVEMYVEALTAPEVIAAGRNTVALLVGFTLVCLVVGLGVAILLDRKVRFEGTLRTIYLLPMALSFIVTGQFWLWMYNVNNGIVNAFVGLFGLGPYNWIGNPDIVLAAVIFALVWQFSGYCMVVYLAALRGIPNDQFEAARVDGASTWRMY